MARKINSAGIALIKQFEGLRLEAYPDPGTGGDPWTCGYGHTGKDVYPGLKINEAMADAWLQQDVDFFSGVIDRFLRDITLTDNQFSALVCFSYNVKGWAGSTLFNDIRAHDFSGALEQWPNWCHVAGKVLPGLVKRREAEAALFRTV